MKIIKDKYAFIYSEIKPINSKLYVSKYYLDVKIANFYPLSFSINDVFVFRISTTKLFFNTLEFLQQKLQKEGGEKI